MLVIKKPRGVAAPRGGRQGIVYHENKCIIPWEHAFDKGDSYMIPKNLEAQMRSTQLEKLHDLVAFYEKQIRESLDQRNFRLARSWHASLSGAYMLAERLGLAEPDHRDRENMWFECIQAAEFGPQRKE